MSDPVSRAARYLERAQECIRIADLASNPTLAGEYRRLAGHYTALAEGNRRLAKGEQRIAEYEKRRRHAAEIESESLVRHDAKRFGSSTRP